MVDCVRAGQHRHERVWPPSWGQNSQKLPPPEPPRSGVHWPISDRGTRFEAPGNFLRQTKFDLIFLKKNPGTIFGEFRRFTAIVHLALNCVSSRAGGNQLRCTVRAVPWHSFWGPRNFFEKNQIKFGLSQKFSSWGPKMSVTAQTVHRG